MRVDFNVPLKNGTIEDDTRIKEALPSIKYVLEQGGALILMGHLGRPDGKIDPEYSLKPCAQRLEELLGRPVQFNPSIQEEIAKSLEAGEILLLENLRFFEAEEKPAKDPDFAKNLAKLGDLYVNDAFGSAHRKHSSTFEIAAYFKGKSAAGFLMEKELLYLGGLLINPKRPFFGIIGGSKISSKIGTLKSLLSIVDALFIGGGMAFTFLKAQGLEIGRSICEDNFLNEAKELLKTQKIFLPEDVVLDSCETISLNKGIPNGDKGMDIGPQTVNRWSTLLQPAKTIFWNGPVGVYEMPEFAKGTAALAKILSNLNATTVVGGGDSIAAINHLGLASKFSHLSTGGGASLEFLEFGHLPGMDALSDKF